MQDTGEKTKILASTSLDEYLKVAGDWVRIRSEMAGRDRTERDYLSVKSCPNTYLPNNLALPGRSIGELLTGAKRLGWKYLKPGVQTWANNEAKPEGWVFLSTRDHPDYPVEHDSKGFFWAWYVPLHSDIRNAWMNNTGVVVGMGGLGSLQIIRRDGSDLLTAEASQIIGSTWLTVNEL